MDKSFSYPSLFPNNKTTTTTNPPHFLVDQDHLDKLSNQLKLLKIDDSTINKILKKFKTVKKEVKLEPIDCQVFEAQQQPFVGYNGLFELAISQVIQCGYGHVLPLIGTKKENNSKKMSKRNNKNISLKEKIILKNAEFLNKIASKKNHSFDNEQISKFVDNHNKCIKKYLILDEKNDQIMEGTSGVLTNVLDANVQQISKKKFVVATDQMEKENVNLSKTKNYLENCTITKK